MDIKNAVRVRGWYIDNTTDARLRKEHNERKALERAKRTHRPFCAGLKVRYGGFKLTADAVQAHGAHVRVCHASGAGDKVDRFAPPKRCYRAPLAPTENAQRTLCNGAYRGEAHYAPPAHAYRGERPEFHDDSRDCHFAIARAKRQRKAY